MPDDAEPRQWLPADVDKAILFDAYEARRCQLCGSHPDEWPEERSDDPPPYMAEAHRCFGCKDIADVRRGIPSENGADAGVHVMLRRVFSWEDVDRVEEDREATRERMQTLGEPQDDGGLFTAPKGT